MSTEAKIMEELQSIKADLSYIKDHLIDPDSLLTEEDYEALLQYREEKKQGKLVPHHKIKKALGL